MRYGMPTLIELPEIEDCAALCRDLDLQFVEFNMNLPQYQPDTLDKKRLAGAMERFGIFYTVHLDENMNVADFNPYVVEGYLRTLRQTIELAKDLQIPVLNMHLSRGVWFTLPERRVYLFDQYRQEYLDGIRRFRDICTQTIGDSPIRICTENYTGYTDFQKAALSALLESPAFGLTLDVGHNHCTDYADEPVILEHADRLYHMHMHDVQGKKDHQALGTGDVDLHRYFDLGCSRNATVLLETKTIAGLRASNDWRLANRAE